MLSEKPNSQWLHVYSVLKLIIVVAHRLKECGSQSYDLCHSERGEQVQTHVYIYFQCLNLYWEQEKMAEIPMLSQSHTRHYTLPRLLSTSLSFTSLYPTLPHSDSPIGLSTASLPPQGQSTSLQHSTFSPFHCNNPKFAAGSSLTLALMAHPIRGMCPSLCTCASQASAAVQAHCLSHRHIFPPLSKALECVHCTFIAGAGFNIHLVFLAFVGNL